MTTSQTHSPAPADAPVEVPVTARETLRAATIFNLVEETFTLGDEDRELTRAYLSHPGAVAVLPVDEQDRVLLIGQYRHPVRMQLWEIPAGLLDVDGEPMLECARRELAEETDLQAETWHTLVDYFTTPGASNESIRIYLAEGISPVPESERHTREDEEAGIVPTWVPLADAVAAVLRGEIHNPSAVAAVLALHAVRTGAGTLRDARAPWEHQPRGIAP